MLLLHVHCALFTNCMIKIKNTQVDHAQDIDLVMPMYNLIEYSDIYQKTLGSLWQYCRDKPALYNNNNVIDFTADKNNSISFKIKQQIKRQTGNGGMKYVKIMVPLKYLNNFWRTLEMPLINCEINLQLK